jgi:UDP-N-acetylglucosamine 2-epimerase (non-hydrolysing)
MMKEFRIDPTGISLVEPVGYMEFLELEANARLVLTDSGGVQEEACILNVPCVTLRENTERPETVSVGANMLAGTNADKIRTVAGMMMDSPCNWKNPYGDGRAGEQIIRICLEEQKEKMTGTV